jgi:hypothetical protein
MDGMPESKSGALPLGDTPINFLFNNPGYQDYSARSIVLLGALL